MAEEKRVQLFRSCALLGLIVCLGYQGFTGIPHRRKDMSVSLLRITERC